MSKLLANKPRALQLFERDEFNPTAFLNRFFKTLSSRAVESSRQELGGIQEHCRQEVQAAVAANYQLFLDACRGIEVLEERVALLRNYISSAATALVAIRPKPGVRPGGAVKPAARTPSGAFGALSAVKVRSVRGAALGSHLAALLQQIDVFIAERDLAMAQAMLQVSGGV